MASVDILDWRGEVAKYAKGVDTTNYEALLDDEIKEVCRDFCEHTHLWTLTLPLITVVADQNDYPLTVPDTDGKDDIEIVESVQYKEDGYDDDQFRPIIPITDWVEDDVSTRNGLAGNWRFLKAPTPTRFYVDAFKVLYLYPIPELGSTDGLRVTLVLKPEDDATKVPAWIWEDWKKTIAWGTAGRLLEMTTQKWFDRKLGNYFWSKYLDRRSNAFLKKTTGYTRRDVRVQIPSFGGSRSDAWIF